MTRVTPPPNSPLDYKFPPPPPPRHPLVEAVNSGQIGVIQLINTFFLYDIYIYYYKIYLCINNLFRQSHYFMKLVQMYTLHTMDKHHFICLLHMQIFYDISYQEKRSILQLVTNQVVS